MTFHIPKEIEPMQRAQAWELLHEYVKNEQLIKHCVAAEAAMRAYAKRFDGDEDEWALTGLLHDFDWEIHPNAETHPMEGSPILRANGVSEAVIYAIQTHAEYLNLERKSWMDKSLFAVDELTGFITAVTLVRPSKSIDDVDVSSVKKKMKDKAFARAVRREDFITGAESLGTTLDEHIGVVLDSMKGIAPELGLQGV